MTRSKLGMQWDTIEMSLKLESACMYLGDGLRKRGPSTCLPPFEMGMTECVWPHFIPEDGGWVLEGNAQFAGEDGAGDGDHCPWGGGAGDIPMAMGARPLHGFREALLVPS